MDHMKRLGTKHAAAMKKQCAPATKACKSRAELETRRHIHLLQTVLGVLVLRQGGTVRISGDEFDNIEADVSLRRDETGLEIVAVSNPTASAEEEA